MANILEKYHCPTRSVSVELLSIYRYFQLCHRVADTDTIKYRPFEMLKLSRVKISKLNVSYAVRIKMALSVRQCLLQL